ncbi:MAG: transposase, partial [Planctomycetes bacterium]|nr:transposase [Planctomycetota bacterium]
MSARGSLQQAEDRAVWCFATASDLVPPSSVGGRTCVRQILEDERRVSRKQRQTAKRIFERIRQEGHTGGYTPVKEAVREIKQKGQEVFVPLIHRPGEARVDFGFALVNVNGRLRKLPFFVMTLPYSDAIFVQVYERMSTEVYSRRTPPSMR